LNGSVNINLRNVAGNHSSDVMSEVSWIIGKIE